MNSENYTYSPKASVFRKSYGAATVTVILEEPSKRTLKGVREAVQVLKDEISNFLNDLELDEIFQTGQTGSEEAN